MQSDEFDLKYMPNAEDDLKELIADNSKKVAMKAVIKSLKFMASNLKHPSLNTHKYDEMEYSRIASVLRCTESAVKSLLFRAYETLRVRLAHMA